MPCPGSQGPGTFSLVFNHLGSGVRVPSIGPVLYVYVFYQLVASLASKYRYLRLAWSSRVVSPTCLLSLQTFDGGFVCERTMHLSWNYSFTHRGWVKLDPFHFSDPRSIVGLACSSVLSDYWREPSAGPPLRS